MIIQEKKYYICEICSKKYTTSDEARKCIEGHDLVYVPIERSDLKRLVQFIQIGEPKLLTQSLITTLMKYSNVKAE